MLLEDSLPDQLGTSTTEGVNLMMLMLRLWALFCDYDTGILQPLTQIVMNPELSQVSIQRSVHN